MAKRIGMEVAVAVAEAVGLCDIDMAAVYPITPCGVLQSIFPVLWQMVKLMRNL